MASLSLRGPGISPPPGAARRIGSVRAGPARGLALAAAGLIAWSTAGLGPSPARVAAAAPDEVRIAAGIPTSLDPALQSDIGSAAVTAQLFESLTAFDADLVLQPALAASWDVSADGRRVVFHLRPDLAFSDGTALTAEDVVGSWLRIIDPDNPSPLASLMLDVRGAAAHLAGTSPDPSSVGLQATGSDVVVELDRPGSDFPAIVSSPTFGIVPRAVWQDGGTITAASAVVSGAYAPSAASEAGITLLANDRYWAGRPAIARLELVADIGGRSPVAAFEAGDLDYVGISPTDASWIRYDRGLGPQLRHVPSLSLAYLGFDTSRPPFDDVRIRQAFGAAVDWQRLVELAAFEGQVPADSMVPPGIGGRPPGIWLPRHDPEAARRLLAEAGHAGGAGLAPIRFAVAGGTPDGAIVADLERELGVTIEPEVIVDHFERLRTDPPPMWILGWIADYPGPDDFLGVLLGTGSPNNYGRWSSAAFDAAISDALSTQDREATLAAFGRALAEVQRDVPTIPLTYGDGWALAREGLLGARSNGLGIVRAGGLAWAEP